MYLFFMISGYLFVVGLSIVLNYLFELFPITTITKFLSPLEKTVFNKIGIVIIPNLIWALIEFIILGSNRLFLLGLLLNILVSMGMIYVIKYGYFLIAELENNIVNIISIIFGCFFGFFCNYLCLQIGKVKASISLIYSFLGLLLIIGIYTLIRFYLSKKDIIQNTQK